MLKLGAAICSLLVSFTVLANPNDVPPTAELLKSGMISEVRVVLAQDGELPSVNLVKVNRGGSGDISPAYRLFLGIHRNGEAFDVDGSYMVVKGLVKIVSAVFDKRDATVLVRYDTYDKEFQVKMESIRIHIGDALNEAIKAKVQDPDVKEYSLKSYVGVSAVN